MVEKKIVVAGSLVLDILPVIGQEPGDILAEGKVTECGGTMAYLGGEVGNTGLALHKMHIPVRLVSKIGSDTIGKIVKSLLENYNAEHILKEQLNSVSSASVALALPGRDKSTLHSRGASQSFASEDITPEVLEHCFLLHFGYPPAMKYLYRENGEEFLRLIAKVKERNVPFSMDMSLPDLKAEPGKVDWRPILEKALPMTDIFLPSLEEAIFLLDRNRYCKLAAENGNGDMMDLLSESDAEAVGNAALNMGADVVLVKAGKRGMYLCTAGKGRLETSGIPVFRENAGWQNRRIWIRPYQVEKILSTTGAGDTAVAGFLASVYKGKEPEEALEMAAYAASICIRSYDTVSGMDRFEKMEKDRKNLGGKGILEEG